MQNMLPAGEDKPNKYGAMARAADGCLIFAPFMVDHIGVFDAATLSFTAVDIRHVTRALNDTSGDLPWANPGKYSSAVAVPRLGDGAFQERIIFGPCMAENVGVFDPLTHAFSTIDISNVLTDDWKFYGGALSPTGLVIFGPFGLSLIGIFDPIAITLTTVRIGGDGSVNQPFLFRGIAIAHNGLGVLAPALANCVGIVTFNARANVEAYANASRAQPAALLTPAEMGPTSRE